ncbi:MAG: hypothetical protein ABSB70_24415 [Candidatus Velthaea sp.]
MSDKPRLNFGLLDRSRSYHDDVHFELRGHVSINVFQEIDEFGMSMPRQTLLDDLAIERVERGEKSRRPVAPVIVCSGLSRGDARTKSQYRCALRLER